MVEVPVLDQSVRAIAADDSSLMRAVFDALPEAAVIGVYPTRRILDANVAFERLFGYRAEDVRDQSVQMLYGDPTTYREAGAAAIVPLLANEPVRFEASLRRKDGREFLAEVTVSPIRTMGEGQFGVLSVIRDVSRQRADETRLRENEGRLQLVTEATLEVPWDWELRSGAFWCSRSLQAVFGLAPHQAPTSIDFWHACIHPDDRARVVAGFHAALATTEAAWSDEYRFRRADGSYAHVAARGKLLRDSAGNPVRMVGTVTDVTKRREEQRLLHEREQRIHAQQQALLALTQASGAPDRTLRDILRLATEAGARTLDLPRVSVWLCEEGYSALRCLDSYEARSREHKEGMRLAITPESVYWEALRGGRTVAASDARDDPRTSLFTESYFVPAGVTSVIDSPIRIGGRLVGVVCHEHEGPMRAWNPDEESFAASVADLISLAMEDEERTRAELALRESEAQMAAILDNMPVAVYTRGLDGRIRFVNDRCAQGLRRAKEDVVGQLERDLLEPDTLAASARTDALALLHGSNTSEERLRLHGRDVTYLVTKFVLRDHRGEPYALGGVLADVSEQKAQAEELAAARRQVAHSEKLSALGSLVSGVAHEIRTPLTYLNNHLFVLSARLAKAAETLPDNDARALLAATQVNLKAVEEGAERIKHLVEDLRRFMRLKTGEPEDVEFAHVVRDALDLFSAAYRGRVSIVASLATTPRVRFDRVQLQQVVINLLENAVDASPSGATIRIATAPRPEGVELVVEDSGSGIAPEVQARMFDAFYTTKPEGTGLGLSIVRRIVENHGGSIECQTRSGEGTRFVVSFPVADARTSSPQPC